MPKKKTVPKAISTAPTIVDAISLQNVRIIESHAKLELLSSEVPTTFETTVHVETGPTTGGAILGNVTVTLNSTKDKEVDHQPLKITAICQCVFACDNAPQSISEQESAMLSATTLQIAWPYLRAHVSSLVTGMGLAQISLPLMRYGKQQPNGVVITQTR